MDEPRVRIEHLRTAQKCVKGTRQWFDRYGLDWNRFIHEGYPVSEIEATGCPMARKIAKIARGDT